MRICSLLPSATEILFSLGLGDQLVAVTHECDYPPEVARFPAVTRSALDQTGSSSQEIHHHVSRAKHTGSSIYHLDQELLKKLNPDIILTQELCDVCAVSYSEVRKAVRLLEGERKVLSLEPTTLEGVLETIKQVAQLTGVTQRAVDVLHKLRRRMQRVNLEADRTHSRPRVFAMEWLDPPFAGGHWVPEMIYLAGGRSELAQKAKPSLEISWEQVTRYDPEVIILMPCGFDLRRTVGESHRLPLPEQWSQLTATQSGQVYAVDGSAYFSRPGPRLVDGLEILAEILHPERFPRRSSSRAWKHLGASLHRSRPS